MAEQNLNEYEGYSPGDQVVVVQDDENGMYFTEEEGQIESIVKYSGDVVWPRTAVYVMFDGQDSPTEVKVEDIEPV